MKPAIETLEALQGAWAEMNTDLQTLYDLFQDEKQSIPPMLLEKRQLETIVDAWNDLKAYGIPNLFIYCTRTLIPKTADVANSLHS